MGAHHLVQPQEVGARRLVHGMLHAPWVDQVPGGGGCAVLVKLALSSDQIRWYAQSAISGFDTLDADDAIENAKADLLSLMAYLDGIDQAEDAVLEFCAGSLKERIRLDRSSGSR